MKTVARNGGISDCTHLSQEPLAAMTPLVLAASSTQPAWLMPESNVRSNSACG